ncbi:MAG TPA: L-seryl-tRNA(Sec) selenium transferase [Verrucomicrobiae bacterium]
MGEKLEQARLRGIPSVEKVLQALGAMDLPRPAVLAIIRRELVALRSAQEIPSFDNVVGAIRAAIENLRRARIQPVINGTGIVVHTNLGRSPLADSVIETLASIGANYNNLEFDLGSGSRGGRAAYLENNLALLCGAEAATVTNNCAAALVLMLRHFCSGKRKEVIISRGELVQIGGGFRIPEVLEASGARLREVGATNKTGVEDYRRAFTEKTGMILKVHRSNFFMGGFVESASTEELGNLAREHGIVFVEDLGSGAVLDTEKLAKIEHEPTAAEVLVRGVDLVCFSGDKLLGGPQAGIIAGNAKHVAALKKEPFFRALRCDKLILSALQTTVDLYLSGRAAEQVPTVTMLAMDLGALEDRARKIVEALTELPVKAEVARGQAQVGGGTLPQSTIESVVLTLHPKGIALAKFSDRMREASTPVIGYIAENRYRLDLRTIFPRQDAMLISAVREVLAGR